MQVNRYEAMKGAYYVGHFKIQLHGNLIASVCYIAIILASAENHLIRVGLHNCFDCSVKHFGPFETGKVDSILTRSAGIWDDDVHSLFKVSMTRPPSSLSAFIPLGYFYQHKISLPKI